MQSSLNVDGNFFFFFQCNVSLQKKEMVRTTYFAYFLIAPQTLHKKIKTKNKPTPLLPRFSAAKKIRNWALQFLQIFSVFAVFELSLSFNCIHKCTYHILYALQNSITSYSTVVLCYTVCMSISILLNTV